MGPTHGTAKTSLLHQFQVVYSAKVSFKSFSLLDQLQSDQLKFALISFSLLPWLASVTFISFSLFDQLQFTLFSFCLPWSASVSLIHSFSLATFSHFEYWPTFQFSLISFKFVFLFFWGVHRFWVQPAAVYFICRSLFDGLEFDYLQTTLTISTMHYHLQFLLDIQITVYLLSSWFCLVMTSHQKTKWSLWQPLQFSPSLH